MHLQSVVVYCIKEHHDAEICFAFFYLFLFFHLSLHCNAYGDLCQRYRRSYSAARILNFGTNIGRDYLCRVRQIQHPHSYQSFYLSIFLFVQYFFLSQIYQELLHLGIRNLVQTLGMAGRIVYENEHPRAFQTLYLSIFSFFLIRSIPDLSPAIRARVFKFCINPDNVEVLCVRESQDAEIVSFAHLSHAIPWEICIYKIRSTSINC